MSNESFTNPDHHLPSTTLTCENHTRKPSTHLPKNQTTNFLAGKNPHRKEPMRVGCSGLRTSVKRPVNRGHQGYRDVFQKDDPQPHMKTPSQFQPIDDNTNFIIFNVWLACGFACAASGSWFLTLVAFGFAASYIVNQVLLSKEHTRTHTTNNP